MKLTIKAIFVLAIFSLTIFSSLILAHNGLALDIIMNKKITQSIGSITKKERVIIPIDKEKEEGNRVKMQKWVSYSFNIEEASVRESKRFKRTSYTMVTDTPMIRLLTDETELLNNNPFIQKQSEENGEPDRVLYREGTTYFKFLNFKENKATTKLDDNQIIPLAKKYILKNNFLSETRLDRIGEIEVCNTILNEEGATEGEDQDFIVQQNVVFRRSFAGKPVVNSQISVGIFPDTKEIIELNHFNWTPLEEGNRWYKSKKALQAERLFEPSDVISKVKGRISFMSGNGTKAIVKDVTEAWYQASDELIPILIVEYDVYINSDDEPRPYMDMISLVTGDEIFLKDYCDDYTPVY
ncbi:MAG: hypothetical protein ACMUIU_17510 [bacterium]